MNFSPIQAYLEPSNWPQQNGQLIGNNGANTLLQPPSQTVSPPLYPYQPNGGGDGGSIRPRSMTERARLANIPMPETSLKCPRCQSTNTKFCYFNNYNLTQPRHFCKSCRRYWTKGGSLRSVPVGGGCRRNKRSKSTASKSSPRIDKQQITAPSTSTVTNSLGLTQQLPPLHFMPPNLLSQLTGNFCSTATDMGGLGYRGALAPNMAGTSDQMNFQVTESPNNLPGIEQWKQQQQFPFFDGSESSALNRSRQFLAPGNDEKNNIDVNSAWSEFSNFGTSNCTNNNNINRSL